MCAEDAAQLHSEIITSQSPSRMSARPHVGLCSVRPGRQQKATINDHRCYARSCL
jgi:hypothetical protein